MKQEIIYDEMLAWRSRYGELEEKQITIKADYTDPKKWPYFVEIKETNYDYDIEDEVHNNKIFQISQELYLTIKKAISDYKIITKCEENIKNHVMDGTSSSYYFSCEDFSKVIYGTSIYMVGSFEEEELEEDRTNNHVVYVIIKKIHDLLANEGIHV